MALNRREFASAVAAGAMAVARTIDVLATAPHYDLLIRGGRVIDPSRRVDTIGDVAIANDRVSAVGTALAGDATETLDARGKIVVPGLIDIHTHAANDTNGPAFCLADGVTGFIDAGSQGADRIPETIAVAKSAMQPCRVLINIGRAGILPDGDTMDIARADVGAARDAIANHRDVIAGVKARLKPGDIVTHMFAPPPNSIVDDSGRILPEVLAARGRGVWFDVGNGRTGHLRWDIVERVLQAGFWPDTFSTDWTMAGRTAQVIDFPNVLSKFLDFGMNLDQVIARATLNPSHMFEVFRDRGTLNVGAPADIAILELRQGVFEFVDNYGNKRIGHQRLFPYRTVLGGKPVPPRA
jgi:dihydroorotase